MPPQRQSFPGSTAISAAAYDPETRELVISFKGGASQYTYPNVPADVYDQLCTADSPGRYWRESIKDQY